MREEEKEEVKGVPAEREKQMEGGRQKNTGKGGRPG